MIEYEEAMVVVVVVDVDPSVKRYLIVKVSEGDPDCRQIYPAFSVSQKRYQIVLDEHHGRINLVILPNILSSIQDDPHKNNWPLYI